MINNYCKIRVHYNTITINNCNNRNSKRLKGLDIIDKSKQYTKSMQLLKTYNNSEYVKVNNTYIKLKNYIISLKKNNKQYYISSDYKYITTIEDMATYRIYETSKVAIQGHARDNKLARRLNNK
jgi:hypothetical protein